MSQKTAPAKAVFLDIDTVDPGDLNRSVLDGLELDWSYLDSATTRTPGPYLAEATIAVTNKVPIDRATIASAPALELICVAATGYNQIDLEAATERGIPVCNARDYATPSVVQHTFGLILALSTNLLAYHNAVRAGRWERATTFALLDYPIWELSGRTLGIVGYGVLGQAVANLARAFGMQVLIAQRPGGDDRRAGRVPLDALLAQIDVLSLHCPLSEQTRGLIDAARLEAMRPGALLINTARGAIIDEPALAEALRTGRIGGAGLDVLSLEPPVDGNPLLAPDIPNLIITPHTAWASRESRQRLLGEVADNIKAFRRGTPRHAVNSPER